MSFLSKSLYDRLSSIEESLSSSSSSGLLVKSYPSSRYFQPTRDFGAGIADDHQPFEQRGK